MVGLLRRDLSHLVHEELLRVVDVVARHEVWPLVQYCLLNVDLDHGHLLVRRLRLLRRVAHLHLRLLLLLVPHLHLRLLLGMPHSHLRLRHLLELRHISEPEGPDRKERDALVSKAEHLKLVGHLSHPVHLLGLLHMVGWHLNVRGLELLGLELHNWLCCGLESIALDVHYCLVL